MLQEDILEADIALAGLRSVRPPTAATANVWDGLKTLPTHEYRTFNVRHKFERLLRELCPSTPLEAVLLLRMVLEESLVGGRSSGACPLTAGEIVENWPHLRERCVFKWATEVGMRGADTDAMLTQLDAVLCTKRLDFVRANFGAVASRLRPSGAAGDAMRRRVAGFGHSPAAGLTVVVTQSSLWADVDSAQVATTTAKSTMTRDENGWPLVEIAASETPYSLRLLAHALDLKPATAPLKYTTMADAAQFMPPSVSAVCIATGAELASLLALRRRLAAARQATYFCLSSEQFYHF